MLVYQQLVHTHLSRINACRKDYRDNRDVRRWTHKMTSGVGGDEGGGCRREMT